MLDVIAMLEDQDQESDSNDHIDAAGQVPAEQDTGTPTSSLSAASLRQELKDLGIEPFLDKYIADSVHTVRDVLTAFGLRLPPHFEDLCESDIWSIFRIYLKREFNRRDRLPHINCMEDIVKILVKCQKVIVVTGAGISTSLGIPDFRSSGGIYSRLEKYNLSDPQELFDISLFRQDPSIFYDFAKELLPEFRGYSPTHAFIRLLQDRGVLLRQYTQNIDDIESTAGIDGQRLMQCHGSFKTASCMTCRSQVAGSALFPDIRNGTVPKCSICSTAQKKLERVVSNKRSRASDSPKWDSCDSIDEDAVASFGVMKPDITFFGEELTSGFKSQILEDREVADLLICIGTSLKVAPVAGIPSIMPPSVPQLFISREPAGKEYVFDLELHGQCDAIVRQLATQAGWLAGFETLVEGGQIQKTF